MNVSIIIVNYNSFNHLSNCINSIKNFVLDVTYEIIVIDNASTEGDIFELLKNQENVKLIQNGSNMGFSKANNIGIEIAVGEYILFLNNDTVFIENSLKTLLTYLKMQDKKVLVGCRLLNHDKTHQSSVVDKDTLSNSFGENFFLYHIFKSKRSLNKYFYSDFEPKEPTEVSVVKGAFIFCSKKIVDELGGFDDRFFFYAEETDFCFRAANAGYKVIYFPGTEIIHLGGATTDKHLWFKFKNQSIAKIQIYQKHYKGIKFFLLVSFHYLGMFQRVFVYMAMSVLKLKINLLGKSLVYFRLLFIYPKNQFKEC